MANQMFCSSCGAGYSQGGSYCPMCGISVSRQTVTVFSRQHQAHCTGCGSKTGERDTYCAVCGAECDEYIASSGIGGQILGALNDVRLPGSLSEVTDSAKKLAPELAKVKERSVFVPAIVFTLVSLAVGIILSLIVDKMISSAIRPILYNAVGEFFGSRALSMIDLSLGPITVWLLTCLGGLSGAVRASALDIYSISGAASLSLGFVVLAVVPVASLLVGRVARKAFIDSQHPGKDIRVIDGLLAAAMFAVVNVILALFPSALGNALNQAAVLEGAGAALKFSVGTRVVPLFLFSFIVAFVVAMPNLKSIVGNITAKNKTVSLSCAAGVSFVRLVLLCGLIAAAIMVVRMFMLTTTGISPVGLGGSGAIRAVVAFVVILLNMTIWAASFFTGGSLALKVTGMVSGGVTGAVTIGALGAKVTAGGLLSQRLISWPGGILLLIAGLWIAVTVMYKLLKNEELKIPTIIGVIAVPAVVLCIISSCASIGLNVNAEGARGSMMLSTASIGNLLMCAIFMALAVGVVYFTKKSQQVDGIVSKLATTPFACAATAVAAVVTCLTMKVSNFANFDVLEDLFSMLM